MPVLGAPDYTRAAIADVLAQSVPVKLLIINQGVDDPFREELERIADAHEDRVFLWSHQPPLPSLAATWNTALDYVWAVGGYLALVVNNDVRLHRDTIAVLTRVGIAAEALFVSCVGRQPQDWFPDVNDQLAVTWLTSDLPSASIGRGGPDFSCFLISHECHSRYRFDEGFIPAYCEDLDYHRRVLLDGQGHRIFSVNMPYLHYGAATLKTADDAKRTAIERAISAGSRYHYAQKWGGPVNEETYLKPFGGDWSRSAAVTDGTATTPYLQHHQPDPVIDPRD